MSTTNVKSTTKTDETYMQEKREQEEKNKIVID